MCVLLFLTVSIFCVYTCSFYNAEFAKNYVSNCARVFFSINLVDGLNIVDCI